MPDEEKDPQGQEPGVDEEKDPQGQEPGGESEETLAEAKRELARLEREIKKLRNENAKSRTNNKAERAELAKLKREIAQVLGKDDEEEVSPEKMAKELQEMKGKFRRERVNSTFLQVAQSLNADPEMTLAWMAHKGLLDDVDPEDEDFKDVLEEKVVAALKAKPELKLKPSPSKSGADDFSGDKKTQFSPNEWLRGTVNRRRSLL